MKKEPKRTLTMNNLKLFYNEKNEHYPISDGFVKAGYMQSTGGYIKVAKRKSLYINYSDAEPNQKWHLLISYLTKFDDKEDAKKVYRIICPELLLWMAEATGIDNVLILEAEQRAREIIDTKTSYARNKAGREIKKIITWNMIADKIYQK